MIYKKMSDIKLLMYSLWFDTDNTYFQKYSAKAKEMPTLKLEETDINTSRSEKGKNPKVKSSSSVCAGRS